MPTAHRGGADLRPGLARHPSTRCRPGNAHRWGSPRLRRVARHDGDGNRQHGSAWRDPRHNLHGNASHGANPTTDAARGVGARTTSPSTPPLAAPTVTPPPHPTTDKPTPPSCGGDGDRPRGLARRGPQHWCSRWRQRRRLQSTLACRRSPSWQRRRPTARPRAAKPSTLLLAVAPPAPTPPLPPTPTACRRPPSWRQRRPTARPRTARPSTLPLQWRPRRRLKPDHCRADARPWRYDGQLHGLDSSEALDATLSRCVAPPPPPPPHQRRADAPPHGGGGDQLPSSTRRDSRRPASDPIRRRPIGDASQTSTLSLAPRGDSRSTKAATNAHPWESAPPARPRLRPTKVLPRAARLSGGRVGEPTAALRQSAIRTEERRNDNFRFQLFPIPITTLGGVALVPHH